MTSMTVNQKLTAISVFLTNINLTIDKNPQKIKHHKKRMLAPKRSKNVTSKNNLKYRLRAFNRKLGSFEPFSQKCNIISITNVLPRMLSEWVCVGLLVNGDQNVPYIFFYSRNINIQHTLILNMVSKLVYSHLIKS